MDNRAFHPPPAGADPFLYACSQFFDKLVTKVSLSEPAYPPGQAESFSQLVVTFDDNSWLNFPVVPNIYPTPPESSPGLMLWPDKICRITPWYTYVLTPPAGLFVPSSNDALKIPIDCVWGEPPYYKGTIDGDPLNLLYDYGHIEALKLAKVLTKRNIFHDLSLCHTKGPGCPAQGILRNYLRYLKRFQGQGIINCQGKNPMVAKVRGELLSRGVIKPGGPPLKKLIFPMI